MLNLELKRDGTKVDLTVCTGYTTDKNPRSQWIIPFGWDFEDELYAKLLFDCLRKRLGDLIESARREAYEQGRKDMKGKQAKRRHFKRFL